FYRRWLLPGPAWAIGESASGRGDAATPVLEWRARQLAAAGIAPVHAPDPDPAWLAEPLPSALAARLGPRYAVLLPGASARHPQKRWPGYAALAQRLAADGWQVVRVPGPDETQAIAAMPGDVLLDVGRPLTHPRLGSVLLGAGLILC